MKKLIIGLWIAVFCSAVQAAPIFSVDFTEVTGYTNGVLGNKYGWNTQTPFGVITNADTVGILEAPLSNWARGKKWSTFNLNTDPRVIITSEYWYGDVAAAGDVMSVGIADSTVSPGGNMPAVSAKAVSAAAGMILGGNVLGDGGTNAWLQLVVSIEKLSTTNDFLVTTTVSNMTTAAVFGPQEAMVSDSNTWHAATLHVGIRGLGATATGTTGQKWRQIAAETAEGAPEPPPSLDTVIWQDDFSTTYFQQEIQWRAGWIGNNNNAAWAGTADGKMVQIPTLSTNKTGVQGRGAVYNGASFQPSTGDTMVVEFDWTMFTGGLQNNNWLDINLQTNNVPDGTWPLPSTYYNSANAAMAFRIEQAAWTDGGAQPDGSLRIKNGNDTQVGYFDPSSFGLHPGAGDNTGDVMRVTYAVEKTTNTDIFVVNLSFSNTVSGMVSATDEQMVTNSAWYSQPDFWFSTIAPNPLDVAGEGNLFDNFVGIMRSPAPPAAPPGYDGWSLEYNLVGGAYDDDDNDGQLNVYEYGLGGDPTNSADIGIEPTFNYGADNNVNFYNVVLTDPDAGISYMVEQTSDLVNGTWTNSGWNQVVTNSYATDGFDEVKHRTWGGSKDKLFLRLRITQP